MSIQLYDEAFVKKLQNWTLDTNINVLSPSNTQLLIQKIADDSNDAPIKLPIISLTRPGGFTINEPVKQPLSHNGKVIIAESNLGVFNAIAISIPYQLDVYTRYLGEADELVRNLIFNIINYPMLKVELPYYDTNIVHNSTIRISGEVQNNSDIPERLVQGQFTRYSLDMVVDDAYLFDVKVAKEIKMCPNPNIVSE